MFRIAAVVALSMLVVPPVSAQEPVAVSIPTIITTGDAVIRRAPDQAFVTLAVETRAKSPRDAQRMNADVMASVLQKLTGASIPKDAIRTTGYSINQEFDYTDGRRVPRDYTARNGLEVRVDDVNRTGDILDAIVDGGATTVVGIHFDVKERISVERDALRLAVEDARARAEALAAGAGRTIDRVLRIEDSRATPRAIAPTAVMARAPSPAPAQTPTSIDPGLVEVHGQILLTVAIK